MATDLDGLFRDHYDRIVRFAYLLTGSTAEAEDVVGEVFRRLARRPRSLEYPGAYLRAAVVNEVHSWRRRKHRERRALGESAELLIAEVSLGARELLDSLAALSAQERAVIVLHYYEDQSIDDIAYLLGRPRGTVASWQSRGLAKLREVVER